MESNEYIRPPGTYYDIVAHPIDRRRAIEEAIVQDHRFAFFYWLKWRNKQAEQPNPPTLISLDWHQDLAQPCDLECEWLSTLDTTDYKAVGYFCWDKLHVLNDGHILAAAYLNLIGDIHVVQKQRDECPEDFVDIEGRKHLVRCYDSVEQLTEAISGQEHDSVILDIDLDYFTESPDPCGGGDKLQLVGQEEIQACLDPASPFMSWIFPRMTGMTIATEPEFCGGLMNSNHLFNVVCGTLFDPPLLSHKAGWRHQSK